ncbi:hypothetical protein LI328DRAFT_123298 [Trichoderma asperelloides]|nr:hypothetical protein LI328DRAFT_123298 [Trichoderma asperelloides]
MVATTIAMQVESPQALEERQVCSCVEGCCQSDQPASGCSNCESCCCTQLGWC